MITEYTFSHGMFVGFLITSFGMILGLATKWWIGLIALVVLYIVIDIASALVSDNDRDY